MIRNVPVGEIVLDHRCQARADVNHEAVSEYADAYRAEASLPLPLVYDVSGKLYLVDGYHRVPAAIQAGLAWLRVRVVGSGTLDDAVWYSTGVNQSHGVRRSNADKRRAVRMALDSQIGCEQSDRVIATHVGVSDKAVASVRQEWESERGATADRRADATGRKQPARKPKPEAETACGFPHTARNSAESLERDPPSEPPATVEEVIDAPPETREPMPDAHALRLAAGHLRTVARTVGAVLEAWPYERARVAEHLQSALGVLSGATPEVCDQCAGEGCTSCGGRGWRQRRQGV